MIYSPQQQRVLSALKPIVIIATDGSRCGLQFTARCHTLIVGPSGCGKSFIAAEIGRLMGLPVFVVNVATWILTAARHEPSTWTLVLEWLCSLSNKGGLIIIDEVDKANSPSEYSSAVRLEMHSLLDAEIPLAAKFPEPTLDLLGSPQRENIILDRDLLENTLRERVMVIGCGAWQSAWHANSRQLGFGSFSCPVSEIPATDQILRSIDPELRQRFRNEIEFLPPLAHADYVELAQTIAKSLPSEYRREWNAEVGRAISCAVDRNLGMRVFEEVLLKAMVRSRKEETRVIF